MMNETITLEKQQLLELLVLAEEFLYTRYSEFSDSPTPENTALMLSMYRLTGKNVPGFFQRTFGWSK